MVCSWLLMFYRQHSGCVERLNHFWDLLTSKSPLLKTGCLGEWQGAHRTGERLFLSLLHCPSFVIPWQFNLVITLLIAWQSVVDLLKAPICFNNQPEGKKTKQNTKQIKTQNPNDLYLGLGIEILFAVIYPINDSMEISSSHLFWASSCNCFLAALKKLSLIGDFENCSYLNRDYELKFK